MLARSSRLFMRTARRNYCTSSTPGKLQMIFTCNKCGTRAVKSFTKNAYQNGVVIVTCPGCEARHLIADNLGWFGPSDESNIEKILAKKGQPVAHITDKDLDFDYVPPDKKT